MSKSPAKFWGHRNKRGWCSKLACAALLFSVAVPQFANAQDETEEREVVVQSQQVDVSVNNGRVVVKLNGEVVKEFDVADLAAEQKGSSAIKKSKRVRLKGSGPVRVQKTRPLVTRAEAVLVGPDGPESTKLRRFTFGPQGRASEIVRYLAVADGDQPKFAIGVSCEEASDTLKTHLKLEKGLVVQQVVDGSPAEKSGVEKHDIVVRVNGTDLSEVDELISMVQEAGEGEKPLTLKIFRTGQEHSIDVTPVERSTSENEREGLVQLMLENKQDGDVTGNLTAELLGNKDVVEIQRYLPGMIQRNPSLTRDRYDDVSKQIKELAKQIEQLRDEIRSK